MKFLVIGTAGHIDHGKSTLVRALTGIDPDRLKEEKARGITIDLGFAHTTSGDTTLAFVDVPGHERFVKNMLAGATGIDVLLLVVAADESVMPQTREHFDICRLLDIRNGVIALTKADLVDADTIDLVTLEVRELVAGSFLADAAIVPVSATTGRGLDALREALLRAASHVERRRADAAFRMPIDRVFSVRGFGTVVTGTVAAGRAGVDDALDILPSDRTVKVRALQGHGAALQEVGAGQRAAINVSGVEVGDVKRGDCLVTPGSFHTTQRLDAVVEVLPTARPVRHGMRVRFHHGTGETLGRLAISRVISEEATGQPAPVNGDTTAPSMEIPPGARAYARLRLEKPVVIVRGDRFVLRAYSPPVTIAGGLVLDPQAPRTAIRTQAGRTRFARLDPGPQGDPRAPDTLDRVVSTFVAERGPLGLGRSALTTRVGLPRSAVDNVIQRLSAARTIVTVDQLLVPADVLRVREESLVSLLGDYHRAQPLSEGLPREEARERLFARAAPALFDAAVQHLADTGRIVGRERLALATHRISLSAEQEDVRSRVEDALRGAGLRPPDAKTMAMDLAVPADAVDQALKVLLRQKAVLKVDTLWFHADVLERLKAEVRALKGERDEARVDVATFKDHYGVTRKFAIPLLEYLDRERVTRRVGETRVVL
jgi:selenocysteine-specific elongation factor